MGALGVLVLKDLKLAINDPHEDLHLSLGASEIRVVNRGATTHLAGKVRNLAGDPTPIDLIADVDLNRRNGIFYAGGRDVDLARFGAQHPFAGVELATGRGDAQIWIALEASHIEDVRIRMDLHDATLAAHDAIALDDNLAVTPRTHFDRLAFVARWLREDTGWTGDVADLVVTRGDAPLPPAGLTLERRGDGDARYRAQTTNLALEPIGSVAMLSSSLPEGLRRWLYLAHPEGQVAGADLRWNGANDFDVDAVLHAAGFASANFVPGVDRIEAEVHGDASALMLQLPEQKLRVLRIRRRRRRVPQRRRLAHRYRSHHVRRRGLRRRGARRHRDPGRRFASAARSLCDGHARRRTRREAVLADQRDAAGGRRISRSRDRRWSSRGIRREDRTARGNAGSPGHIRRARRLRAGRPGAGWLSG